MKKATSRGVATPTNAERRYTIACLHNANPDYDPLKLEQLLAVKSPEEMHDILASPDVQVTNAKDKMKMLPVLNQTDHHVRMMFRR